MTTDNPTPNDNAEVDVTPTDVNAVDNAPQQPPADVPATEPKVKVINTRARWAFGGAMLAELLFLLSAFVPYAASLVFSGLSALLAIASMVIGIIAMRRRPRNLAVAALVFSGVLIIIYLIVAVLLIMLPQLLSPN